MDDLIDRQAAIDAVHKTIYGFFDIVDDDSEEPFTKEEERFLVINKAITTRIKSLPSAQPTLYGYDIEHLELIANVLRKENLPPERITEVLTDIGRIVAIIRDEFEETLRKAVERCKI